MDVKPENVLRNPNLHIVFLVTLLAVMGVSSITPAFPQIIKEFNLTPQKIGLLITAFTLPGIFLTPFTGILADHLGRKAVLVPSLILFGIAGFACTFTRNFEILLILRFFQGIGAASLGSINVTLIGDLFSGNQRATAMGYNSSVLSIGTASYPAIGGALAMAGWNYPFLLPLLAIPLGLIVLYRLKNPEPDSHQPFRQYLLNTWKNINQGKVWGLFVINILIFVVLYGTILTFFPIYLENSFHVKSLSIGLVMSIMSVTTATSASQMGKLVKRFSQRSVLLVSLIFYALGMLLIPIFGGWFSVIIFALVAGGAHGMMMPNIQTLLVGMAPLKERAAFMSLNSMVLRTGQTLGPLIMGFFFTLNGPGTTFLAASGIALIMLFITWWVVK